MSSDKINWGKPPSDNISLNDCEWYHLMEVPGVGEDNLTPSVSFDIREDIGNILRKSRLQGKKSFKFRKYNGSFIF